MTFALYNKEFESVVSGDDGSFIAVWDIENGKLMSKFGDAHKVISLLITLNRKKKLHIRLQQDASTQLREGW